MIFVLLRILLFVFVVVSYVVAIMQIADGLGRGSVFGELSDEVKAGEKRAAKPILWFPAAPLMVPFLVYR